MAEVPVLNAADEAAAAGKGKAGGKGKLIIIAVAALVALTGGGGAAWLFLARGGASAKHEAPRAEAPKPPIFVALDPPFVVNFEAEQQVRFLQITVQLMSRDPATIELLKANDPVVRNDLLLLFGNQKYAEVATLAGKEKLRAQALAAVRKVIAGAGGQADKLEAIYFTSFVMQ